MLIAFCIEKYFPFGGLQRDFLRIASAIHKRGHAVRVYTREWQGEVPEGFEIIKVQTSAWTNHGKGKEFCNFVISHVKTHPVDRLVGFNRMPGLDFYFAGDVCFAEKVTNRSFFYRVSNRCRHYLNYEKAVFERGNKCKILLLVSSHKKSFQNFYGTESERFYVLPPGIDKDRGYSEQYTNIRQKFRLDYGIASDDVLLLQVCSNFELKGVDRSIRALSSLSCNSRKKVKLFVVGDDCNEKMVKLAQKLSVEKNVRFLGGRKDVLNFMVGADLMLHPARREAAGIVILESIASGLPIVVSAVCGYAPYVEKANSGVILEEPFDQDEYNQTVRSLVDNKTVLTNFSHNAILFAKHEDLYSLPDRAADIILS